MNYIRIFRGSDADVEARANALLAEAAAEKHRVMTAHVNFSETETRLLLQLTDEPHPHKKP